MNNLFFLKIGKKLFFSNNNGKILEEFSCNFSIEIENKTIIDLYQIICNINNNKVFKNDKLQIIKNKEELYIVKLLDVSKEFKLDDLLFICFQKIKNKFELNNVNIQTIILIYNKNKISYELRLLIYQALLLNNINIYNFIDDNKAISFYIEKNFNEIIDCFSVIGK